VDLGAEDEALVGYVFVALHSAFILHSAVCFVQIVREVRRAGMQSDDAVEPTSAKSSSNNNTAVVPTCVLPPSSTSSGHSGGGDHDAAHIYAALKMRQLVQAKLESPKNDAHMYAALKMRRLGSDVLEHEKRLAAATEREVSAIHRQAAAHRKSAVASIQARQVKRRETVQARVAARNKAKQSRCLQKCPAFAGLDEASVETLIDAMDYTVEAAGHVLCEEGGDADRLFVIVGGVCDVSIQGKHVAKLNELDVFGEGALFEERVRSARVAVAVPSDGARLLVLKRTGFDALVASGTLGAGCVEQLKLVGRRRQEENKARGQGATRKQKRVTTTVASSAVGAAAPAAAAGATTRADRDTTKSKPVHKNAKKTSAQPSSRKKKKKKAKKTKKTTTTTAIMDTTATTGQSARSKKGKKKKAGARVGAETLQSPRKSTKAKRKKQTKKQSSV